MKDDAKSSALARGHQALDELRRLVPDQAERIDALAAKIDAARRRRGARCDGLAVKITTTVRLIPQDERAPTCR